MDESALAYLYEVKEVCDTSILITTIVYSFWLFSIVKCILYSITHYRIRLLLYRYTLHSSILSHLDIDVGNVDDSEYCQCLLIKILNRHVYFCLFSTFLL